MEWVWRTDTSWEISLKFSKNGRLSGYTPHLLPSPASPMECIEAKNWRQQCRVAPQTSGQLWMMFNLCLFHTVNIYIYIYILHILTHICHKCHHLHVSYCFSTNMCSITFLCSHSICRWWGLPWSRPGASSLSWPVDASNHNNLPTNMEHITSHSLWVNHLKSFQIIYVMYYIYIFLYIKLCLNLK